MIDLISVVSALLGGSVITIVVQKYSGKMQKMKCYYLVDEILSRIPQQNANGDVTQNLHHKQFRIKNTTNIDIREFQVIFQFDQVSEITECYCTSKEGLNVQKIRRNAQYHNQAEAIIRDFNRGDCIDFYFRVANVVDNKYYVSESKALGFKIKCVDKREKIIRSQSPMSNTVLINNHI